MKIYDEFIECFNPKFEKGDIIQMDGSKRKLGRIIKINSLQRNLDGAKPISSCIIYQIESPYNIRLDDKIYYRSEKDLTKVDSITFAIKALLFMQYPVNHYSIFFQEDLEIEKKNKKEKN